jgi:hypothetical protein
MSQTKRLGSTATTVYPDKTGETVVRYHATEVVRFSPDKVTLNSGGWKTATTKLRMNQASNQFGLGYTVRQKDFSWFVDLSDGEVIPFTDGMTFRRS